MGNVQSLGDIFDGWCSNIETENPWWKEMCLETYGFEYRCVVSKDIPPRHSVFSWIRGLGVSKYDEIFGGYCPLPSSWLLAFPERHTSLDEQRSLIAKLKEINDAQGRSMKRLDILTSSTFIIGDTKKECLSIIAFPEGKKTYDQDYMSM